MGWRPWVQVKLAQLEAAVRTRVLQKLQDAQVWVWVWVWWWWWWWQGGAPWLCAGKAGAL